MYDLLNQDKRCSQLRNRKKVNFGKSSKSVSKKKHFDSQKMREERERETFERSESATNITSERARESSLASSVTPLLTPQVQNITTVNPFTPDAKK